MNCGLEMSIRRRCEAEGPIRVAVVGAGAAARMIIRHLLTSAPGIRLIAVANRTLDRATEIILRSHGCAPVVASSNDDLAGAVARNEIAVTPSAEILCGSSDAEVVIEASGTVELGARVALQALTNKKHVVLVNAELDLTLGPILNAYAEQNGVVFSHTDGEEPGVAMTLLRYLKSNGLRPVAAGNLKGMIDRYRTPDTQREFAAKYGMNPKKVASFADGTKLSMETCILANATGFRVGQRGMFGPKCSHVRELVDLLPAQQLLAGGLVDYALGAEPHTGAFVLTHEDCPEKRKELSYFKMGDGPFYAFYAPYHLPHVQIISTIARAVLFYDATVAPCGAPVCEVASVAKRHLKAGEVLDGVGGFMAYGTIENSTLFAAENLLPIGVAEGCRMLRAVAKDSPITYADVELPEGRLCDRLRAEQTSRLSSQNQNAVAIGDELRSVRAAMHNCEVGAPTVRCRVGGAL